MNPDKLKEIVPDPAQSFQAEFGAYLQSDFKDAMSKLKFQYRSSDNTGEQVVHKFERRNGDGTTIEIVIKKGANYQSPAEISKLPQEEEKKKNNK